MIATRLPVAAARIVHSLTREEGSGGCVGELQEAAGRLDREGFAMRPDWTTLRGRSTTACRDERRTWRMATRLAVPCVFHFRTPLSGDHGAVIRLPVRPSALEVSFGTRIEWDPAGRSHGSRVQCTARTFHWCWRGYGSRWMWSKPGVSVGRPWTFLAGTGRRAHTQEG